MFSNKIFKKYCSEEWLVIYDSNKKELRLKPNEMIFSVGDPVNGIYFIEKGKVKVLTQMGKNDLRIIRLAGNDTILGHRGIHFKTYHIAAETLEDTLLTYLPIDIFIKILKANPEMAMYLINFMSEELKESESRIKFLSISDPKIRVACIIVKLIDLFGYSNDKKGLLSYTLKRSDIANMANTTYETVIRSLSYLCDIHLIALEGKKIIVKNEKKLRAFASY